MGLDYTNISPTLDEPFYEGAPPAEGGVGGHGVGTTGGDLPPLPNVPGSDPITLQDFQVAIAGHAYPIEPTKCQRATVDRRRDPKDESVEPGEQSISTGGLWKRAQSNWFLGAGQEFLDNMFSFLSVYVNSGESPSVRTRFWRSKGVNPWTEGALSLLPEYAQTVAVGTGAIIKAVGGYLYLWDGTNLKFSNNPSNPSPTWTTVTVPSGLGGWPTVTSMCTTGQTVYLACGQYGIIYTTAGSTSSYLMRPTPGAPSLNFVGTTGITTHTYAIVATDANGFKSLVGTFASINNCNATLTSSNYVNITWTAVNGASSYDVLKDGSTTALATGITQTTVQDTGQATTAYTAPTDTTNWFNANTVIYAAGFLLVSAANVLYEALADGLTSLVWKNPDSNFTWDTGAPGNGSIYVIGHSGSTSAIYGITSDSNTGGLAVPYPAGQVAKGEIVHDMVVYAGMAVLGTSLGVRLCDDSQGTGKITTGPVITDPGEVWCVDAWGSFAYCGWSLFNTNDGYYTTSVSSSGLGRLYLSEFASSLQPGYTTDVMGPDGTTGTVKSMAIVNGTPFFVMDGVGLFGPTGHLVSSGYLEPGVTRWGMTVPKTLVTFETQTDPLVGSVQTEVIPIGGNSFSLPAVTTPGSTTSGTTATGWVNAQAFMFRIILNRSTSNLSAGPTLRQWVAKAIAQEFSQDQIVAAIRFKERSRVGGSDGQVDYLDMANEYLYLQGFCRSGVVVAYQEGNRMTPVTIDKIALEYEGEYSEENDMLMGTMYVSMISCVAA